MNFEKNKGITLIALVISIIILLILAGISINALTGQNGILNKTIEAKEKNRVVSDLEYLQVEATSELIDYYQGNDIKSESDYILDKWSNGNNSKISVNKTDKTVTYNGNIYSMSDIIGNENEKTKINENKMEQITISTATDEKDKKILSSGKVRIIIEEENNMRAYIPNGFYYVTGKPSTGMVISDIYGDDDENTRGGNQFVWVPCSIDTSATKATNNGTTVTYEKVNGLAQNWKILYGNEYNYTTIAAGINKGKTIDDWKDLGGNTESVKKYGGFYIARYEAGLPLDETLWNKKNGATYGLIGEDRDTSDFIPVSKKNNASWNMISQKNALIVSKKMYENSQTVESNLIDSYAWDTVISWYSKTGIDCAKSTGYGNYLNTKFGQSSENEKISLKNVLYAVHSKNELTGGTIYANKYNFFKEEVNVEKNLEIYYEIATGSSEYTKKNNIYDLAGNMWEWTTEVSNWPYLENQDTDAAVFRGGSFIHQGDSLACSSRNGGYSSTTPNIDVGFRVVLYLKV